MRSCCTQGRLCRCLSLYFVSYYISGPALQGLMVDERKAFKKREQEQGDETPVVVLIYVLLAGICYMSTWAIFGRFIKLSGDL